MKTLRFTSIVSLWEMAIKISLGKLRLSQSLGQIIAKVLQQVIKLLDILPKHVICLLSLPFEHRDPFDRLLIAQSLTENLVLISNEALIFKVWREESLVKSL